jgi:hypothetical protein
MADLSDLVLRLAAAREEARAHGGYAGLAALMVTKDMEREGGVP